MKRILLLLSACGMVYITMSSYKTGASSTPQGAEVSFLGCSGSGSGCHGSASSNTTITVTLIEDTTGKTVTTSYAPGTTYSVTITGNNSSAAAFGYMTRFKDAGNMQAGSLSDISAGSKIQSVGGFDVAEHSAPIVNSGTFSVTFTWTSPPKGTGTVTINTAVNAVNNDGTATGDEYSINIINLQEGPALSVNNVAKELPLNIYPNPTTDKFTLQSSLSTTNNYVVYSITGQVITTGKFSGSTILETSGWSSGTYILQVFNENGKTHEMIVKQ